MANLCKSKQAPFLSTLSVIEGKWKLRIVYELACETTLRYGALKRAITPVTHKMLSAQLKSLESDGIIIRNEYPQVPPRVEYSLSPKGLSLLPILNQMCKWGQEHMQSSEA